MFAGDPRSLIKLLLSQAMVNWGTVPEWFGGISLLWAFWLFGSARADRRRAQVDLIGTWLTQPEWDDGPAPEVRATLTVRNGSSLPVTVHAVEFYIRPLWETAPSSGYMGASQFGKDTCRAVPKSPIPPGEDWTYRYARHVSTSVVVTGITHVYFSIGMMVLTDNAGRMWRVTAMGPPRSIPSIWDTLHHPFDTITWRREQRREVELGVVAPKVP